MKEPRKNKLKQPSGLYLTPRDRQILHTIYQYDGMMTFGQIMTLFFNSERTTYGRILKLVNFGYIAQPSMRERMSILERIYWLTPQGAAIAAQDEGIPMSEFEWVKKPRMDRLPHHIPLNNVRVQLMREIERTPELHLISWTGQFPFAQHTDKVDFRNTSGELASRYIEPDALFIVHNERTDKTMRALLELDRATKDTVKIANQKVLPTLSYIASENFKLRTGFNSGRMLFVVQSGNPLLRIRYLKRMVEQVAKQHAAVFWFTTYEAAMKADSIIFDRIWYQAQPRSAQHADAHEGKISEEPLEPMALMLPADMI